MMMIFARQHLLIAALALTCLAVIAPGQSAAELAKEKSADIARSTRQRVDELRTSLTSTLQKTEQTLRVLRTSQKKFQDKGLEEAADDFAAIAEALERTQTHLREQLEVLARLKHGGAPSKKDPLQEVLTRLEVAMAVASPQNRLAKRESNLKKLLTDLEKSDRLSDYAGLVLYHIGDTQYQQAVEFIGQGKHPSAKLRYERSIRSFERIANEKRNPVKMDPTVGTSLRATTLSRLVILHTVIFKSDGISNSVQKAHMKKANKRMFQLKSEHATARFANQRNVVAETERQAREIR